jgi:hypothetical protein
MSFSILQHPSNWLTMTTTYQSLLAHYCPSFMHCSKQQPVFQQIMPWWPPWRRNHTRDTTNLPNYKTHLGIEPLIQLRKHDNNNNSSSNNNNNYNNNLPLLRIQTSFRDEGRGQVHVANFYETLTNQFHWVLYLQHSTSFYHLRRIIPTYRSHYHRNW